MLLLVTAFLADIFSGNADIPFNDALQALMGGSDDLIVNEIIRNYRLPKAITAVIAGAALSLSGLLMQTLFRNPLAGPDVLGVSAGAGLGVALLTMLSGTAIYPLLLIGQHGHSDCRHSRCSRCDAVILTVSSRIKDSITILVLGMILDVASAVVTFYRASPIPIHSSYLSPGPSGAWRCNGRRCQYCSLTFRRV